MNPEQVVAWLFMAIFIFSGVGFFFAKVDEQQVAKLQWLNRFFPGIRLYQFRAARYIVGLMFLIMAAVVYLGFLSEYPQ